MAVIDQYSIDHPWIGTSESYWSRGAADARANRVFSPPEIGHWHDPFNKKNSSYFNGYRYVEKQLLNMEPTND